MTPDEKRLKNRDQMRRWRQANPSTPEQKAERAEYMRGYYQQKREERREYMRRYHAENADKVREQRRRYQQEHREELREKGRQWREANQDVIRQARVRYRDSGQDRAKQARRRHGSDYPQVFAKMWEEQDGCCYLCERPLTPEKAVVDHDHACCPRNKSCALCRRGLACASCNSLIGHAQDDPDRLRKIADNLEPALRAARERIVASGAVICVYPGCMDSGGQRPQARMEIGRVSGEPQVVWSDGTVQAAP